MSDSVAEEVRLRRERVSATHVTAALRAALLDAIGELVELKGVVYLDEFLARRLALVESSRRTRPGEPAALAAARRRDADAVEAAMRAFVQEARTIVQAR